MMMADIHARRDPMFLSFIRTPRTEEWRTASLLFGANASLPAIGEASTIRGVAASWKEGPGAELAREIGSETAGSTAEDETAE